MPCDVVPGTTGLVLFLDVPGAIAGDVTGDTVLGIFPLFCELLIVLLVVLDLVVDVADLGVVVDEFVFVVVGVVVLLELVVVVFTCAYAIPIVSTAPIVKNIFFILINFFGYGIKLANDFIANLLFHNN